MGRQRRITASLVTDGYDPTEKEKLMTQEKEWKFSGPVSLRRGERVEPSGQVGGWP